MGHPVIMLGVECFGLRYKSKSVLSLKLSIIACLVVLYLRQCYRTTTTAGSIIKLRHLEIITRLKKGIRRWPLSQQEGKINFKKTENKKLQSERLIIKFISVCPAGTTSSHEHNMIVVVSSQLHTKNYSAYKAVNTYQKVFCFSVSIMHNEKT